MLKVFLKKIFYFSLFLFVFFSFSFLARASSFADFSSLDPSCFEKAVFVDDFDNTKTVKIKIKHSAPVFFLQNNKELPAKIFKYGKETFLNYKTIKTPSSFKGELKYLNDNNSQTFIELDPYSKEDAEIIIDALKPLRAGDFRFFLLYSGAYQVKYYTSLDNKNYLSVANPQNFDWRYLKIVFKPSDKVNLIGLLQIKELNIVEQGADTFLLNPQKGEVWAYSVFDCRLEGEAKENFQKIISAIKYGSADAIFSINTNTKIYNLSLQDNPRYNNDFDDDGVLNDADNCPYLANKDQGDKDGDLLGDACDYDDLSKGFYKDGKDSDYDGVGDELDNCPRIYNPQQNDSNGDGVGDLCADDDNDGIIGIKDNCPTISNVNQKDLNVNGVGDACEFDKDEDGVFDSIDNCINTPNKDQKDSDGDNIGDLCDNCEKYNPGQIDKNNNGIGDVCERAEEKKKKNDQDKDSIVDYKDNCKKVYNPDQKDYDNDGVGDLCDNCPKLQNKDQADKDKNGTGDLCEDYDGDGIISYRDNCPYIPNPDQKDSNNNNIGDLCEDYDNDGVLNVDDNCPYKYNPKQRDTDKDGVGNICDKKDNRFVESNRIFFVTLLFVVVLVFGFLIFVMINKIKSSEK